MFLVPCWLPALPRMLCTDEINFSMGFVQRTMKTIFLFPYVEGVMVSWNIFIHFACMLWVFHHPRWYQNSSYAGSWDAVPRNSEPSRYQVCFKKGFRCVGGDRYAHMVFSIAYSLVYQPELGFFLWNRMLHLCSLGRGLFAQMQTIKTTKYEHIWSLVCQTPAFSTERAYHL